MLGRVRLELGDSGPSYVWSAEQIYQWLAEGLTQLSLDLPPLRYISFYAVPGQREYPLNSYVSLGLVGPGGLQSVEAPRGQVLPPGEVRDRSAGFTQQNTLLATDTAPRIYENCWALEFFTHDQPYLIFRYAPVDLNGPGDLLIGVWAYGYYLNPPDDTTALDVGVLDEQLLVWYVVARAVSWLAEMRGKRADFSASRQRSNAAYYERLYSKGIEQRRRVQGAKAGRLVEQI
jgi:hypothetical protein